MTHSSQKYYVGIDGGGSKTRAVIIDANGQRIATGLAGPSNFHQIGVEAVCQAVEDAIADAKGNQNFSFDSLYCGISGAGLAEEQLAIIDRLKTLNLADNISVTHDAKSALSVVGQREGIVVIAGTGSLVWGQNLAAEEARSGGWGPLLGDPGGGFEIALSALRKLCEEFDECNSDSLLVPEALNYFECDSIRDLVRTLAGPEIPRVKVAGFSQYVFSAAGKLDSLANLVLDNAAMELAQCLHRTRKKLFKSSDKVVIVPVGKLLTENPDYLQRLIKCYNNSQDRFVSDFKWDDFSLAEGAALLGRDKKETVQSKKEFTDSAQVNPAKIFEQCKSLATEQCNPVSTNIDQSSTLEILKVINSEDKKVAIEVEKVLPEIAKVIDQIVETFNNGGRLIYIGAGTSGRLGVLDSAECPPTFGTPPEQVQAIIAGGNRALLTGIEGAEDDVEAAEKALREINFDQNDFLVGIAASGRTPYVLSGLAYAKSLGAQTALICCAKPDAIHKNADTIIAPLPGPEVVMGSTRMKAGTAQKMILNMLTTASMIRIGKVYENMMVDLQTSNRKLIERAKRTIMMAASLDYELATELLNAADGNVKLALVIHFAGCTKEEARDSLKNNSGRIRDAVESIKKSGR